MFACPELITGEFKVKLDLSTWCCLKRVLDFKVQAVNVLDRPYEPLQIHCLAMSNKARATHDFSWNMLVILRTPVLFHWKFTINCSWIINSFLRKKASCMALEVRLRLGTHKNCWVQLLSSARLTDPFCQSWIEVLLIDTNGRYDLWQEVHGLKSFW